MIMLSVFFRETTVHGLRYVVEAKSLLARTFWALLVLTSFACATIVIVLNVRGWAERCDKTVIYLLS